jgi:hypothetical protein
MDSYAYQILRTNSDLGRGRRTEGGAPDLAGRILRAAAGGAAHQTQGHGALGTEVTSANEQMADGMTIGSRGPGDRGHISKWYMTEGHQALRTEVRSANGI